MPRSAGKRISARVSADAPLCRWLETGKQNSRRACVEQQQRAALGLEQLARALRGEVHELVEIRERGQRAADVGEQRATGWRYSSSSPSTASNPHAERVPARRGGRVHLCVRCDLCGESARRTHEGRPMSADLDGRVAVVTGGSRGLGLEMVRAYRGGRRRVVIASRKGDACDAGRRGDPGGERPRLPRRRLPRRPLAGLRPARRGRLRALRPRRRAGEQRRHVAALRRRSPR